MTWPFPSTPPSGFTTYSFGLRRIFAVRLRPAFLASRKTIEELAAATGIEPGVLKTKFFGYALLPMPSEMSHDALVAYVTALCDSRAMRDALNPKTGDSE